MMDQNATTSASAPTPAEAKTETLLRESILNNYTSTAASASIAEVDRLASVPRARRAVSIIDVLDNIATNLDEALGLLGGAR